MNFNLLFQHPYSQENMILPSYSNAFENVNGEILNPHRNTSFSIVEDYWQISEIKQLFQFYDTHGAKWKNMATTIQNRIRTPNNLKNKFYTVLRNLVKFMFRYNTSITPRVQGEISSRDLSKLYDGSSPYMKFQGAIRSILQIIEYDIKHPSLVKLCEEKSDLIRQIYEAIYKERAKHRVEGNVNRPQRPQTMQQNCSIPIELPRIHASTHENQFSLAMNNFWFFNHNPLGYYYMVGQQRPQMRQH